MWALSRWFPAAKNLLEIGCGTGFVLQAVRAAHPDMALVGGEIFPGALDIARTRVPDARLEPLDARELGYRDEFDVVCAFDVLEHVEEDELALRELCAAAKPGGGLLVTVPQHPWLWSALDEVAQHCRRYRKQELLEKLDAAGFEVLRITSFVSLLLPAMAFNRLRHREVSDGHDPVGDLTPPPRLNALLTRCMAAERALLRRGLRLPAGGSLLAVARRREDRPGAAAVPP